MEITYTKHGDYYYPNLALPEQSSEDIGRFGRMRKRYLKEHRKAYYSTSLEPLRVMSCWHLLPR